MRTIAGRRRRRLRVTGATHRYGMAASGGRWEMQASTEYERALSGLDAVEVAGLLEGLPGVVMAMRGEGPFAAPRNLAGRHPGMLPVETSALARVLARPEIVIERLRALDRFTFQLVSLAVWHGGLLRRDDALAEAGPDVAEDLERSAERLRRACLAERDSAWLALLPGVDGVLGIPGIAARDYLQRLRTDDLAAMLRNLGIRDVAARKDERIDQLEAALRDPRVVTRAVDELSGTTRALFDVLVDAGGIVALDDFETLDDIDGGELGLTMMYGFSPVPPSKPRPYGARRTLLHELTERALLGIDVAYGEVFVPLDVQVALRGGLFARWEPVPKVATTPVSASDPGPPAVLRHLDALLRRLRRAPVDGLKSGGIGVRAVRQIARELGLEATEVALVTHLAVDLDLIGSIATTRGTNTRAPDTIWTTTALADDMHRQAPMRVWAQLVAAWLDDPMIDDVDGLPEKVELGYGRHPGDPDVRRAVLDALAGLPEGEGVDLEGLFRLADHRHPTVDLTPGLEGSVAALRLLGLVPADGPVGLTPLARTLVREGPGAAAELLPEPATTFTVQPDHTVVAPPGLDAAVAARLSRYAACESAAGASVHRLDEVRVADALDAGETAQEILDFLAEHSTAGLPQNVEVLVRDVERRHGQVVVGAAASYVVADDPVLIAEAVGLKAAKLRQLAPTVAVSSLSRGKLLATLAAKGLMPVAEGADGARVETRRVAEPEIHAYDGAPPVPEHGLLDDGAPDADLLDLARQLLDGVTAGSHGTGRR